MARFGDTEDLHILLRPELAFKLEKGPRGEALYLRGAARVEHDAAQPKRTLTVKYTDGATDDEKRFVTNSFPFRLFTTILGITFTTAYCFFEYFVNPYDGTFFEFVHELCYDSMTNELDDEIQPAPAAPSTPAANRVPGGRSPQGSPAGGSAVSHTLCRVSGITGWAGTAQPKCGVCGMHATRCCSRCSRAADKQDIPALQPGRKRV